MLLRNRATKRSHQVVSNCTDVGHAKMSRQQDWSSSLAMPTRDLIPKFSADKVKYERGSLDHNVQLLLDNVTNCDRAAKTARFFKTGKGEYGEHDRFLGITNPEVRSIAKQLDPLPMDQLHILVTSAFNEERFLALLMLENVKDEQLRYNFYMDHISHINNWNLVDLSAPQIVGQYLFTRDRDQLLILAESKVMWERRIAIVSTFYFIRKNYFDHTLKIAALLLEDTHDLIHKAVGWMLREMGKRDKATLVTFLKAHHTTMPRTMLRYSIEKFPAEERSMYLKKR